jgi:hypothetical protein
MFVGIFFYEILSLVTKITKPVQRFNYCDLKWFELLAVSGTVVYTAAVQYG